MLKATTLHFTVDTASRTYKVHWFAGDSTPGEPQNPAKITVRVETTLEGGCVSTENFNIPKSESTVKISTVKDLKTWFYKDFAYQYADLHEHDEDSGCLRASILYDLGNYKIAQRNNDNNHEAVMGPTKWVYDDFCNAGDVRKIFYVSMNDGDSSVYCFSSYDNAEQWANEKLYQNESIKVGSDNVPYTIFTVKAANTKNEFSDVPLDLPCSMKENKSIYNENIWVDKTDKNEIIYHLTQKQLDEFINKKKNEE